MLIGLEIHQQLNTKTKLFCRCPTQEGMHVLSIKRKQRPIAGEMGEVDKAAIFEYFRDRTFEYLYSNNNCLIELDSDFPRMINKKALKIAILVARLLKMHIPNKLCIMRKIITDGSNTSGYQRTVLIGIGSKASKIKTSFGDVRIKDLELEEDSAAIVKSNATITYKLDRLGIPLIEIGTYADIRTPEQAKEAAENIGLLLRTFDVKRGIGSIRQDVNISIEGGARVEIKGFQYLEKLPELIRKEEQRQKFFIWLKEELKKRNAEISEVIDVTEEIRQLKIFKKKFEVAYALLLKNFRGLLKMDCGGKTFGKELAYYAQAFGLGGLIHNEELPLLNKTFELKENDDMIIVVGSKRKVEKVVSVLKERLKLCFEKIPAETRVALEDCTTKYTRPLPGAGRLYPETDLPLIEIPKEFLLAPLPETLLEKREKLLKELPKELAGPLIKSKYLRLYEKASKKCEKIFVASTLVSTLKELKREGTNIENINESEMLKIFELVGKKKISKKAVPEILRRLAKRETLNHVIKDYEMLSEDELEKIVDEVLRKYKNLNQKALMGIIMKQYGLRVDGAIVFNMLKKKLDKS